MGLIIIAIVACLASLLTFFSGFGLGTVLLPVFAVWFPIERAIALTAVVHLLNNLFKLLLTGKYIRYSIVLRFGIPAIITAFIGAWLLLTMAKLPVLYSYSVNETQFEMTWLKVTIAFLIVFFVVLEQAPFLQNMKLKNKHLPIGGAISGFFGGLSGHQGALRSAFLVHAGLSKEEFIATGTAIGCVIDIVRLSVYSGVFTLNGDWGEWYAMAVGSVAAFLGAYLGNRWIKKITMATVQKFVSAGLLIFAAAMFMGWI